MAASMSCRFLRKLPLKINPISCIPSRNYRQKYNKHQYQRIDPSIKYTVPTVENEYCAEPQYPPVTPRWPPGKWENMKEKDAWDLYEEALQCQDIRELNEKLYALTNHDDKVYYTVNTKNSQPRILHFQQHVTKTAIIQGLPSVYENISADEEFEMIKPIIIDGLLREFHTQHKHEIERREAHRKSDSFAAGLARMVTDILFATLAGKHEHLMLSQVDRDARIECFWRKLVEKKGDDVEDKWMGENKYGQLRYKMNQHANITVRTELPLMEFLPRDDLLCSEAVVPEYHYHPRTAGVLALKTKPTVCAGYKTKDPFTDGSPCQFGLVSFHSCDDVANNRLSGGQDIDRDFVTATGMLGSFGWTVAQAYNQGFDWLNDVTYPFTTQTVVTEGRKISFFAYQLNTMLLWKNNDNNPLRNILWASPEMELYKSIENNEVIGFNDDALKTLIKMFKNAPMDRGVDLRPYISENEPRNPPLYMNNKGEAIIERPHPPRYFSESKKVKVISPVVETQEKITKLWEKSNRHWNEETKRFDKVERI